MNIPIFLARQLVKHQVGGVWNEVSRRYVDDIPTFWKPTEWRERGTTNKQGSGGVLQSTHLIDLTCAKHTEAALAVYVDLVAGFVCPEQALVVLPLNTMTQVIWTGSLYFFARVYNTRIGHGAQAEAAEFAKALGEAIAPLFHYSWAALTGG